MNTHLPFLLPHPVPICILLPAKQEACYHAAGDSRTISKICYPHALNKIKLKVLLHCQDKDHAREIILHSQTLNYWVSLYQIRSKNPNK